MSDSFQTCAAMEAGKPLQPYEFKPGPLGHEQVEIRVESCGICHSDLSMIGNDWGNAQYPLVPGHEAIGIVEAAGEHVKGIKVGDRVGVGWFSESCMACQPCLSGNHNLCATAEATIVGRPGGFADRTRAHWSWAIPLPDTLDPISSGPLFCGGITVFGPIAHFGIKPTDRVGVVGIGGLGHMALQFLNKWGCEVTAFSSSESKAEEAKRLGAHSVVNSRDSSAMEKIAGSLDFILVTVNVPLDWESYINTLAPDGRLHFVGAVLEPVPGSVFQLLMGRKSVSASPLGSPATVRTMLDFCGRHDIAPQIETFKMEDVNDAMEHLESGKARYRVVLTN